jgi:radical SAM superfamily enzyme YgiQ (UPF0313 family)
MKILLIDPSKEEATTRKKRGITKFPQISLRYLAGLTPAAHEVRILEEEVEPIDFAAECDLVGITCMTANSTRAYEVADKFRRMGKQVVFGGVHPTVRPEEAGRHADAVVVGEAEPVWEGLLQDAQKRSLAPIYRSGTEWSLDAYALPRRDPGPSGAILGIVPVVTSRGCPYACDFCCVRNVFGRKIRHVSIARVMEDIERSGASRVMFLDDNIVGDQGYAEKLFDALKTTGIQWVGQASVSFVRNERLLEKASESGCRGLFVGLESVSEKKIQRMQKSMKTLEDTAAAIRRITESGILFHASIVFGFDDDDVSIFDQTLQFLMETRISSATFNILTPYPGTEVYDRFKAEGRLFTEDWGDYDHCTPTFVPKLMSVDELVEGYNRVKRTFLSLNSIAARLPANWRTPLLYLVANIGQRMVFHKEQGTSWMGIPQTVLAAGSAAGSVAGSVYGRVRSTLWPQP